MIYKAHRLHYNLCWLAILYPHEHRDNLSNESVNSSTPRIFEQIPSLNSRMQYPVLSVPIVNVISIAGLIYLFSKRIQRLSESGWF